MYALTLFYQNFRVVENFLYMYQIAGDLEPAELPADMHRAVCAFWNAPEDAVVDHASNDRLTLLVRPTARIPRAVLEPRGLDFVLRQAIVVTCTALETFFWDIVRENVLTIIRARRTKADDELRNLTLTLEEYVSIEEHPERDVRLQQIILRNFQKKVLYNLDSIDQIARMLTVHDFWTRIEKNSGESATNLKRLIGELIARRNRITHRADRAAQVRDVDAYGLEPINYSWVHIRVQAVKTLVIAATDILVAAVTRLEQDIETARQRAALKKTPISASQP